MGELGELLRSTREALGLSLAQAEEDTRIRRQYLEALEEEDFGRMPARVYVRGFLRNYALYLGLNPEEVLALRGATLESAEEEPAVSQPLGEPLVTKPGWGLASKAAGVLLILAVIAVGGWWAYNQWYMGYNPLAPFLYAPTETPTLEPTFTAEALPTETETAAVPTLEPTATAGATSTAIPIEPTPTEMPSPTPTLSPTATPLSGVRVQVEVLERTWLVVTVDGEQVFEGALVPEQGTRYTWTGQESVSFHCGNAAGINVTVNGEEIGTLGESGEVVDLEWTAS